MSSQEMYAVFERSVLEASDLHSLLVQSNEHIGLILRACRVLSFISENGVLFQKNSRPQNGSRKNDPARDGILAGPYEWVRHAGLPEDDYSLLELLVRLSRRASLMIEPLLVDRVSSIKEESRFWDALDVHVAMVLPLATHHGKSGCLVVFRDQEYDRFTPEDLVYGQRISQALSQKILDLRGISPSSKSELPAVSFEHHSDALLFSLEKSGKLTWVNEQGADYFGVPQKQALEMGLWPLLLQEEKSFLEERLAQSRRQIAPFREEIRLRNQTTGRERSVLLSFSPIRDVQGQVSGWNVIGVDISDRAEAQTALELQTRKVQALYSVSSAIRGHFDPAAIGSRGLQAVMDALQASGGFCFLGPSEDLRRLSLVSQRGLGNEEFLGVLRSAALNDFLFRVADGRQPIVCESLSEERRFPQELRNAFAKAFSSAVFIPILVEKECFGVLALFDRKPKRFSGSDLLLLSAASGQVALAARQANTLLAYRRQTRSLLAVYRMSHELSTQKSLPDVYEQAFKILRDELGLKRVWLGLLGSGERLIGTAAFGPGWKRRLVEMVLDTEGLENPITEAIHAQKPVVVNNPRSVLSKFGLERFFSRFAIQSLAFVPLQSGGKTLGVLAVQPGVGVQINDDDLSLLSSIANEIASQINTRRLEERLRETERMQSTALLAAGIAHNFNNVLQAVLGQASLLEMQRSNPEQVERAAKIISESAARGATVVRQLLSVANLEEARKESLDINEFLKKEQQEFVSWVPNHQALKFSLKQDIPKGIVDRQHLRRILGVLVRNAVDAIRSKGFLVQVFSDWVHVDAKSLHFEVPEGEYIRIGVRDNGVGMDSETRRRCFEPFFSTKNVDPGTGVGLKGEGLGLAAAYALTKKNGGRLTVESRLGQGSLFTIYLPVDRSSLESRSTKELSQPASIEKDMSDFGFAEDESETESHHPFSEKKNGQSPTSLIVTPPLQIPSSVEISKVSKSDTPTGRTTRKKTLAQKATVRDETKDEEGEPG